MEATEPLGYVIIATDHRYPTYVTRRASEGEQVSRTYARLGNALRQAAVWAEWYETVTVVAAAER